MGVAWALDEGEGFLTKGDLKGEMDFRGEGVVAVDGDNGVVGEVDVNRKNALGVEKYCTVGEGMGADGGHGEGIDSGVHDGSTCREIISRRARCGAEEDAVGAVGGDVFFVALDGDFHEMGLTGVFDNDVVEGVEVGSFGSSAVEGATRGEFVFAFEDGFKGFGSIMGVEGGEESEFTAVKSEYWRVIFDGLGDGREEGAVAADDAAGIDVFEEFRRDWVVAGGLGGDAEFLGFIDELVQELGSTGFLVVKDKSDTLNRIHELRISNLLYIKKG